ncbi:unnamed protein product [Paramecium sonneborni]|uniref:Uncharacterized protein n=1 Tax=Paramecium sonneborni TaxID=65129 RepID=A0A8S1MQF1_9CILI|nr:unnamed protein product [Paramecium sonneborni]
MDLKNKNTRKILLHLLEQQLQIILTDNYPKTRFQNQLIKFQDGQTSKLQKSRQQSLSPQIMRTHAQSEHINTCQKQQSQLKQKYNKLQQSKDKLSINKLQEEVQDYTIHSKILKSKNLNTQVKQDIYKPGINQINQKANHLNKLKESCTIQMNQQDSFNPAINKISQKITQKNNQTDFFQRMNTSQTKKLEKIRKLQNEATPSFRPQINNHYKKGQKNQNKDILQVSVNLELLEKVRDYHLRENNQQNLNLSQTDYRNIQSKSVLSQTRQSDFNNSNSPSFRNSTTINKQSQFHIDFNSPNNNFTKMLQEALGESLYD